MNAEQGYFNFKVCEKISVPFVNKLSKVAYLKILKLQICSLVEIYN